jgi:serine/threonine protein kinase
LPATGPFIFRGTERFEVKRRLGAGGMGIVYEAFDRERETLVALKTLRHVDPHGILRLKKEFRSLQDLEHPNLISLGELIEAAGEWFFTMELIEGGDFLQYVRSTAAVASMDTIDSASFTRKTPPDATPMEQTLQAPSADDLMSDSGRIENAPVGSDPVYDEGKLRAALGQLAVGLDALHKAGKVHRDIKPSNVLVTTDGRVVLLDFGLISEITPSAHSMEVNVVGKAAYMAPEQAAQRQVGAPADWYSFGVVMYEALTGRVPFTGNTPLDVLAKKQSYTPPPPRAWIPNVPKDLDSLCVELLNVHPDQRPDGRTILELLAVATAFEPARGTGSASSRHSHSTQSIPFIGREDELAILRDAYRETRDGKPVTVLVHGESGLGKSALIRHFTEVLVATGKDAVVLTGRCYERESVPYKAFDGVIDSLARYMQHLPEARAAALLPLNASLLPMVFPVLGTVRAIARAPIPKHEVSDSVELRNRVFAALRELLHRLAQHRPPILVIDDLQWADADSLQLLGDIMRPPDAPPVLLLISSRTEEIGTGDAKTTADAAIPGSVRSIHIAPFETKRARKLARMLLQLAGASDLSAANTIAGEAGGHPLFIDELVRHATSDGSAEPTRPRLDEAIWHRASRLEPPAIHVLQIVSVAGAPLTQEVIRIAADMEAAEFARRISQLRTGHLVRSEGVHAADLVEPYHDRIREAVLQYTDDDDRQAAHTALGRAIEEAGTHKDRPELLVRHLEAAGDFTTAALYAVDAAERASRALAFDRAADLYRTALRLGSYEGEQLRSINLSLADALAHAGRGAGAADAYLEAVEGSSPETRRRCLTRAAEQLLITGYLEKGLDVTRSALAEVGVTLPPTARRALFSLLWYRMKLRLRGMRWTARNEDAIDRDALARLDVFQTVSGGLAMVDPIRGGDFQARSMLLSLKLGEPTRIARALSWESIFVASVGGRGLARGRKLVEHLQQIASASEDPHRRAFAIAADGIVNHLSADFTAANDRLREAEAAFRELPGASTLELNNLRLFRLLAMQALGTLSDHRRLFEQYLRDAIRRGDHYAETSMRRHSTWLFLASGKPERARRELEVTSWLPPEGDYHLQHWYELQARAELALYEGKAAAELDELLDGFSKLEASMMPRIWLVRVVSRSLAARVALGAMREPSRRADALREVRRLLRQLRRERTPIARAVTLPIEAGLALQNGEPQRAVELLVEAGRKGDEGDLHLLSAFCRLRIGQLDDGDLGQESSALANEWMDSEEIADPERMAELFVPGFHSAD